MTFLPEKQFMSSETPSGIYTYSNGKISMALSLKIQTYPESNSLSIMLVNVNNDRFFNSLTVDITDLVPPYCAYLNVGIDDIRKFVEDNHLARPLDFIAIHNGITYPLYKFNVKELRKAYYNEMSQYEALNSQLISIYNRGF